MHLTLAAITSRKKARMREDALEFTARLGYYVTLQQEQFVQRRSADGGS
jgi:hypothetical protein